MPENRIVITGAGVASAIGLGQQDFFDAFLRGESGVRSLADRDDEGPVPPPGCENDGFWIGAPIVGFDGKQFVKPRKALKVMSREIQLAYVSAMMAIEDAGLDTVLPASVPAADHSAADQSASDSISFAPQEIGTVFGSEMLYGPPTELAEAFQKCLDENGDMDESRFGEAAMRSVMPLWMLKYLPNMPACHVGIAVNAHGPNNSLVVGDTSGPAALDEAISCLTRRIASCMITGAAGTRINATRLNYRNDLPIAEATPKIADASRPFDPESKGVVGGEAAAVFVLETLASSTRRGAAPLAEVVGIASRFVASGGMSLAKRSCDIHTAGIRGSAKAIELAVADAMRKAKVTANDIGFVVSHAMGDPIIDVQERDALQRMLPNIPVVTPISTLGHTGAASGSIELLVGVLALKRNMIPPSIQLSPTTHTKPVVSDAQRLTKRYGICLSHTPEGAAIATVLASVN
ncbi:3-oxoacyl-[acyl-carrier-protein] synthase 2 [Novipirellula galeiformis]|uniref:3-oxoacyl-[acyl-carrier-protein] synthase 2 n=1 Tax=Novipirellula galeiformis TaxID=2528004 RepID=A0A5C6CWR6_9BACT|nr:beta-ketoacyl synthase N-terminal-like domain-containing protein [Novipirellula galeiformis]TWU27059.1 3-oxoacyl-[acyl-carrier-protein] synthase 2 [Novipirellula galeiformis]